MKQTKMSKGLIIFIFKKQSGVIKSAYKRKRYVRYVLYEWSGTMERAI